MDSFENLMKRLYGRKKNEDEPSILPFDSLVHELDRAKPAQPLKLLYRLIASSAAVIITTLLVLKYVDWVRQKNALRLSTISHSTTMPLPLPTGC